MELREQLEEALEELLATGGDSRQVQDPDSGLTKYGCSMKPRPDVTPLGSCTASSISETGYAAAAMLLERCRALSSDVDLADVVSEYFDAIRSELQFHFCRHDVRDLDILLSPSGTDAELLALAIAHGVGRPMVTNILIGPSEVGSGTPAAAAGQYFDELTPSGRQAKPGEPIDHEMASRTSLVCISLREANGLPRDEKEIDSEVEAIVAERVGQGHQILLHVIAHSKTGLHAPSLQTVRGLKAQHGERITVVVDAAQGRFSRRGLRRACDDGHLVMTTGSKFFGGPPFAGALLVPPAANPLARGMAAMPVAFGDFFAQDYFPASWASVAANLPRTGSLGALLRWAAALAEIREYYATPSRLRLQVLRAFEHAVPDVLGSSSCIRMDEISEPVLGDEVERLLQSKTTVFSFFVLRRNGEALGYEALRKIWRWLNLDMSAYADAAKTSSSSRDLAPCMQIGQPVRLGSGDGAAAVLRVALGGALLTHVAQDPNWGGTYEQREARMIDSLILLKRKIEAIVNHFDHLVEQEAALESLGG